jgi:FkbM family methyltransferase
MDSSDSWRQGRGLKWIVGASTYGCWLGIYEFEKSRQFAKSIKKSQVIWDIGANVGFYTLLAANLTGPSGKVVAFEPLPRNLNYLNQHIALNHFSNIQVEEIAISDTAGIFKFDTRLGNLEGTLSEQGDISVRALSLDEYISKNPDSVPHCIKIDVEGAELKVLEGGKEILKKFHPQIFLATHGTEIHRQCCDYLKKLGYVLKPIVGRSLIETDEILATYAKH